MNLAVFLIALTGQIAPSEADLISLARSAVRAEVTGASQTKPVVTAPPKGVFVTIERKGRVVGCRGTLAPKTASLQQEIVAAARAAATHDPRYQPLKPTDLREFLVTVTVVEREEPINDIGSLLPEQGLVLRCGSRTGVVLPWEGKDPSVRLGWAYRKAGVAKGSAVRLSRLIANRFRG